MRSPSRGSLANLGPDVPCVGGPTPSVAIVSCPSISSRRTSAEIASGVDGSRCRRGLPGPSFHDADMLGPQPQVDPPRRRSRIGAIPGDDSGIDQPRLGRDPLDLKPDPPAFAVEPARQEIHGRAPHELGHETVTRAVVDFPGRPRLDDPAPLHDRDPVSHRHRLSLVVGDVEGRGPEPPMQRHQLGACRGPERRVEAGERLVEQEDPGPSDDRTPQRHPLRWPPRGPWRADPGARAGPGPPRPPSRASPSPPAPPCGPEAERQVLEDRQMRIEHGVLEDHRHVAIARRQPVGPPAVDPDDSPRRASPGRRSGGAACSCPTPTARRSRTTRLADRQVDRRDRLDPSRITLRDPAQLDLRQATSLRHLARRLILPSSFDRGT